MLFMLSAHAVIHGCTRSGQLIHTYSMFFSQHARYIITGSGQNMRT